MMNIYIILLTALLGLVSVSKAELTPEEQMARATYRGNVPAECAFISSEGPIWHLFHSRSGLELGMRAVYIWAGDNGASTCRNGICMQRELVTHWDWMIEITGWIWDPGYGIPTPIYDIIGIECTYESTMTIHTGCYKYDIPNPMLYSCQPPEYCLGMLLTP